MIRLAAIWIYPVKSLAGVRLDEAVIDDRGFVGDRRFMLVDAQRRFITQRERPKLANVKAELGPDQLHLRVDDAETRVPREVEGPPVEVIIWGDTVSAVDAGDEAAALLSAYLGTETRLVRMPDATHRPADPEHARPGDLVSFADGFPFLLTSTASLDALNVRLAEPVDMRRFRPNLVVSGARAFGEDDWGRFEIGGVTFHAEKSCSRCSVVDVDPDRGTRQKVVLAELSRFRKQGAGVNFGQNLVHDGTGTLRVGMTVDP